MLSSGAAFVAGSAAAKHPNNHAFEPGAPGVGDEYFPLDGNGGYYVKHYDLSYERAMDTLTGGARIEARATQNLSSFNLDLDDLTVRSVRVNSHRARWTHADGELTITPSRGLRDHKRFAVRIAYDGMPQTLPDFSGFFHTDDGPLEAGQPHGAATWYPVNDHPSDKASYTFEITVPRGPEAISNGELERRAVRHLRLLPRRHGPTCAAERGRRRAVLPPAARLGTRAGRRPRHDRGVHRDS